MLRIVMQSEFLIDVVIEPQSTKDSNVTEGLTLNTASHAFSLNEVKSYYF